MDTLVLIRHANVQTVTTHWSVLAAQFNIDFQPTDINQVDDVDYNHVDDVDYNHVQFWSQLSLKAKFSLPDAVRILRGQTGDDPRPNKDLYELQRLPQSDITTTIDTWNSIVRHGVVPRWKSAKPQLQHFRPSNHRSSEGHDRKIRRHLRKGQLDGRYLIVHAQLLDHWPEIFISPLAVVDKPGAHEDDIRLINDYSFPPDHSVNDYTDRSDHPPISYNPPKDIARRIHQLKTLNPAASILIMLGDVAGAFRHIPIHANSVYMFSFLYQDLLVIDLSCGFGWCGSPAYYAVAGKLINHIYEFNHGPDRRFTGNVWCDDHTCVEVDEGSQCFDANIALRRAMAIVLGPAALNENKFTKWATKVKALGILWDTDAGCASIPTEKLDKALTRVSQLIVAGEVTKTALLKVLGSLRHVATCSRPARAFFQRLQSDANILPRFGARAMSSVARDDLRWFQTVLQHPERFNSIPLAQFAELSDPDVHIFMDASSEGLCALDPLSHRYLRQQFSKDESEELSINVRELRSAVLAALRWGPRWHNPTAKSPVHVQFHIDNTSAVTWANQRSSRHPTAQLYNRLLSLAEFQYNLVCTASHIPGKLNVMADAGSRAWRRYYRDTARRSIRRMGSMLIRHALAESTTAKYRSHWRQWCRFTTAMGWSRWLTSANSSRRLGYFATLCWAQGANSRREGNQYSTINLKLASIKWFHRRYQDIELKTTPRLALLLQGIKRLSHPRRKKQPITMPFLRLLHRNLDLSRPRQRLLWGSILIGFFFMLRRSEYLVVENTRHFYCLKDRNVFFSDKHGKQVNQSSATSVTIGLEGAKNDQYGRGAWRTMHASGDQIVCPLRGLRHIKKARKELGMIADVHLCGNLSSQDMNRAIKRTAKLAGVPPSCYATHSVRIGGATALVAGGADRLSIKLLGRWASNCFEEYPQQSAKASAGLSTRMVQNRRV
ncbi:hypothetical protein PHPALM_31937 [Phytophthora palmivora]|uniref:Tyr recombinase domain-containing protein n=1 Tax=Phytophthora palmivora TaxID=4796 RepID=A0A2P4X1D3_9STRA|nr:hypothetical protein PHPALM_31937 [Phytophthora palmivora]